jgi:2-polyprenyl-3-methyl-5-hydroxy-6-metoxy-1,4-benzoquinol methylase
MKVSSFGSTDIVPKIAAQKVRSASSRTDEKMHHDRHGAKQPHRFDPARAAILDDTARFDYVSPDALLAELALARSATLVDFGAGTGLYAIALAQRRPDLRIIALDEQLPMLEHLRGAIQRAGLKNIEAVDRSALEQLRERADGVLALNVLHEVGDAALDELRSLLTAGGIALFVDWNADVERPVGPPREYVYSTGAAVSRLEGAGFTVETRAPMPYHFALAARPAR